MNFKLPLIAVMVAALGLGGCGGGGSDSGASVTVSSPASLVSTDVTLGTGAAVTSGMLVNINYNVWLYNASASDFKGAKVDSGTFQFTAGAPTGVIQGVAVGVIGVKVGGERVLLIPAAQAYGSSGQGAVPPNSGLVFDMVVTSAK